MNYEKLFNKCVDILLYLTDVTGLSYQEVNVWVFVIIEPAIFIIMLFYILYINNKLYRKSQQV